MKNNMTWKGWRTIDFETYVIMSTGEHWCNVPLYLDEVNHSPTGFEWGYNGSGPAQLSYAILRTYFEIGHGYNKEHSINSARKYYYNFKTDIISKLNKNDWVIDMEQVAWWLTKEKEKEK